MDQQVPLKGRTPLKLLAVREQLRLLREWVDSPWYSEIIGTQISKQDEELKTLVTTMGITSVSDIFTREQFIGELRGVTWVRKQVAAKLMELNNKVEPEPPIHT
jgi:hypothetical protein